MRWSGKKAVEEQLQEDYSPELQTRWLKLQSAIEVLREREALRKQGRREIGRSVQVVCSDVEAVVQPDKTGKVCPSYHANMLVEQHLLIVGQDVAPSSELHAMQKPLAEFQQVYGEKVPLLLMDTHYSNFESLKAAASASEDVLCPPREPERKPFELPMARGLYAKSAFSYDPKTKTLVCPQGRTMTVRQAAVEDGQQVMIFAGVGCANCPVRGQCTKAKTRQVKTYEVDAEKQRMRERLKDPGTRARYALRGQIVELALAQLKATWGVVRFRRRGLRKVRMEFGLWCLVYNLWKTMRLLAAEAV